MSTQPKLGLLVPLQPKADKAGAVGDFLLAGHALLADNQEPGTLQWLALRYENSDSHTHAIFDTFADEAGRGAHIAGAVAAALLANADALLAAGPLPAIRAGHFDVLASKVRPQAVGGVTRGLACGLRVLIRAKPEKAQAVKEFLQGALPLVEAEPKTPLWYAIAYPGTNVFGIVDFFPDEDGREAHLKGKVAEALFASVDELLEETPDVVKVQVVAAIV